jgi:pilus assembly protein CpaF
MNSNAALKVTVIEEGKPQKMHSFERFPIVVGRAAGNDIALHGWKVARIHAEIHQLGSGFKLVDRGSLAGTWVNSQRIVEYGPLSDTDEILICGFRLKVQIPLPSFAVSQPPEHARAPAVPPVAQPRPGASAALAHPAQGSAPGSAATGSLAAGSAAAKSPAAGSPAAVSPAAGSTPSVGDAADAEMEHYLKGFEWRRSVRRHLLEIIDLRRKDVRQLSDEHLRIESEALIREILQTRLQLPSDIDPELLITDVLDEVVGLGPMERLLADPTISEVMVNKADEIYVERNGRLERCKAAFTSDEAIRAAIDRIVSPLGRRVDEASPMVDARLKDGSRVNAIIPPLALKGPTITIRKFNKRVFGPEDLMRLGSANRAMIDFLKVCVENRKNIIVAGGTGSGKTTLLNVLSNLIPKGERIVTIEDAAELKLNHGHLVSLEARPSNLEGKGVIAIRDLVKNSLRMRPDRIIVGECRGGETLDMLQAMNTGHDGSLTTVHANSPRDVISRLEVMTLLAGLDIPVTAIREQVASAVDVIVQQMRLADGSRRITHIVEVTGMENGTVQLQELFRFERVGFDANHRVVGYFTGCDSIPTFYEDLRAVGVELDLSVFAPSKPREAGDERRP